MKRSQNNFLLRLYHRMFPRPFDFIDQELLTEEARILLGFSIWKNGGETSFTESNVIGFVFDSIWRAMGETEGNGEKEPFTLQAVLSSGIEGLKKGERKRDTLRAIAKDGSEIWCVKDKYFAAVFIGAIGGYGVSVANVAGDFGVPIANASVPVIRFEIDEALRAHTPDVLSKNLANKFLYIETRRNKGIQGVVFQIAVTGANCKGEPANKL